MVQSRRRILQASTSFPVLAGLPSVALAAGEAPSAYFAYIGCRTTRERYARGKGISVFRVEPSGEWRHFASFSSDSPIG